MPQRRFALLLIAALACGAAGERAHAQTPEDQLVSGVAQLYQRVNGPRAPGAAEAMSCALVLEAHQRWDTLSPEARARLAPFLTQPATPAALGESPETPAGGPSAPSSWLTVKTPHFVLNYVTSGPNAVNPADADHNGIPDYVDAVGGYLETAFSKETVTLGYAVPAGLPYQVYFRDVQFNGLTHPINPQGAWMEICSDIIRYNKMALGAGYDPARLSQDPAGVQAGLLKAVCAHELFHTMQVGYARGEPAWWMEGTADWMGSVVYPESGFFLVNTAPHLEQPYKSLTAQGNFLEYSASLFPLHLAQVDGGPDIVRKIWEACRTQPLEQAIGATAGDLRALYVDFAVHAYLRDFPQGNRMIPAHRALVTSYPAMEAPPPGEQPEYLGCNYVDLTAPRPGTLSIQVQGVTGAAVRVIAFDKEHTPTILAPKVTAAGTVGIDVPGMGSRYVDATVVVARIDAATPLSYFVSADLK